MTLLTRRGTTLMLAGALAGLGPGPACATSGKQTIFAPQGIAIGGYDPVAYFLDKAPVKGEGAFAFTWQKAVWHFRNAQHRERFAAEPARFAPQFGGHCSVSMANRRVSDGDPKRSGVLREKLYLNGTKETSESFWRAPNQFIPLAEAYWASLAST